MPPGAKKPHPALKHGAYSTTTILPGENIGEFKKLHERLIAELAPEGPLEEDIVATIARLVWRKQHLATFELAERARNWEQRLISERLPTSSLLMSFDSVDPAETEQAVRDAEAQSRRDLGDVYDLVEIGDVATLDRLVSDLEIQDRLDGMLDRCLKRLLLLRGLKSISASASMKAVKEPKPAK
jgi:hypothetical protein